MKEILVSNLGYLNGCNMSFTAGHKMGLFQPVGAEGIDPAIRWGNTIIGCHPSIHPEGLSVTVKFREAKSSAMVIQSSAGAVHCSEVQCNAII